MIGIDVVDVERFRAALARTPALASRLFTKSERTYCEGRVDPVRHLAGTFAAKEAIVKAAGLPSILSWARQIEVSRDPTGAPVVAIAGRPELGVALSISHDSGTAVAAALLHPSPGGDGRGGVE